MNPIDWGRLTAWLIYVPVAIAIGVFLYSGLYGDRGIEARAAAALEIDRLEVQLAAVEATRREAENRVRRLKPGYLDLDLLDERARAVLGYVRPDEIVIDPVTR
ncbi:MAG: septum formation initiator family protein [Pseudomonadota bacterium]